MKKQHIHQFHSGSAFGDAVTNSLFYTQKILQDLGFVSHIYVEHVDEKLKDKLLHYSKLKTNSSNILLIHHSMGHEQEKWILSLKEKIILVYHNITPANFFSKESPFYHYSLKGREQLKIFQNISVGAIGVSKLNVDELLEYNFDNQKIKEIPLLIDYETILNHPWNYTLFDKNAQTYNILFVGRIAENKNQLELIKMFKVFTEIYNFPAKLFLVGGISGDSYEQKVKELIINEDLEEHVILTGKVSYEDLYSYYHIADAFVCLSEHEGFGVPLIESMIFDVPVIAYDSSNIKNTLNGSGILFLEKNLEYMAGFLSLLANNRNLRRAIIKKQRINIEKYQYKKIKYELATFLNNLNLTNINLQNMQNISSSKTTKIQIEGPFDSSYSLALLNREMAKSLNKIIPNEVALFSTEGPGDFKPNQQYLEKNNFFDKMYQKSKKANVADVVLRNLYPPRVYDAKGLINLTNSYGWEESTFPEEYISDFNKYLDALPVTSKYVQKVMIDNGLAIPAPVIGDGITHMLEVHAEKVILKTHKKFKFLHISSCFPRKGVDVLLKAYYHSFTKVDDVCLIIKTFPNIHNNIEEQILRYRSDINCPEIELINEDLSDKYIVDLYQTCNCLVAPSRGEGYGLPMAEAMLFNLPVITTGYGGQIDFCTDSTSWLIDYDFDRAKTHMELFNSYWAEPKWKHLSSLMLEISKESTKNISIKTKYAKENILKNHKWDDCAKRMLQVVNNIENQKIFQDKKINLGWVSTWNTKCGIATYSKFLIDHLIDDFDISIFANYAENEELFDFNIEKNVKRTWQDASDTNLDILYDSILKSKVNTLIIQFNFGFFNLYALEELIIKLQKQHIKIFITFHSVSDVDKEDFKASIGWINKTLQNVETLFVHNITDLNILKSFQLIDNVTLFPHGVTKRNLNVSTTNMMKEKLIIKDKKIISSYGFLLPHKGIKELIEAFSLVKKQIKDSHLLLVNALYPNPISDAYFDECISVINKLDLKKDITIINDFLDDNDSMNYLGCADILVMPYKETQESASGAIRYAISTNKPVLCTPINIFRDVEDIVHFTDDCTMESLASSISELLINETLLLKKKDIQKRWIDAHDWVKLSSRLKNIIFQKSLYE
jgi:glycosyltransferase involved in cell wall biosynthesis